jgi:hypothetical protein
MLTIAELDDLASANEAANWVHRRAPDKNLPTNPGGRIVESRVDSKLEAFADEEGQAPSSGAGRVAPEPDPLVDAENGVDVFTEVPEEMRPGRRRGVSRPFACATRNIVNSSPNNPHHLRFAQPRGARAKAQRQIHRPCLSHASSRTAWVWRRGVVVGACQRRSRSNRACAMAADAIRPCSAFSSDDTRSPSAAKASITDHDAPRRRFYTKARRCAMTYFEASLLLGKPNGLMVDYGPRSSCLRLSFRYLYERSRVHSLARGVCGHCSFHANTT